MLVVQVQLSATKICHVSAPLWEIHREMPLSISTAPRVPLCVRVETKGECQSDGGSAGRLFLLSQIWDLRRGQTPIKGQQGLGQQVKSKAACVSKKKTQIKAWIWWGCVIWEEESCLSITNKTCSNAVPGSLAYANGWGGDEDSFFCPDQNNLDVVDLVKVQLTVFLYCRTNFYYYWWTQSSSQRWAHFNCVKGLVHSVLYNIATKIASVHLTIFTHQFHGSGAIFSPGIIVIYSW